MELRVMVKQVARLLPPLRQLMAERDRLYNENARFGKQVPFVPNGHFYSPIPSLDEIRANEKRIFPELAPMLAAINLDPDRQLALLRIFAEHYYKSIPFGEGRKQGFRYFYENPAYSYSDAIFLHCMIRHAKPQRIVEVGSGYSSCATLDTNEHFFNNSIACTFIEPYPELLRSLVSQDDLERVRIIPKRVQDVELGVFQALQENDILFIDSTHVSKIGSDVNRIFFEILPALASGVYIHFHDIFYPFEYPREWVYEGRAWNEGYMLRAFLQYNSSFEIVCFNTFLERAFEEYFIANMPLCLKNRGGSIWLRKS